jgi:hypothetical protein
MFWQRSFTQRLKVQPLMWTPLQGAVVKIEAINIHNRVHAGTSAVNAKSPGIFILGLLSPRHAVGGLVTLFCFFDSRYVNKKYRKNVLSPRVKPEIFALSARQLAALMQSVDSDQKKTAIASYGGFFPTLA